MADQYVTMPDGKTVNFGDPDNTDPRYKDGNFQLYRDAQDMMSKVSFMEQLFIKTHAGPKTLAYYEAVKSLADSQTMYGFLPTAPDKFED